ncbi:MAG: chemotaxis protein CheW [Candidatus Omnitrophota bacterium]
MKNASDQIEKNAIDWWAIHRRIEAAQASLERGETPTAEEKKRILQARARMLAQSPESGSPGQESLEVLEFMLAYEQYAIEISFVREAVPLREFTPLPSAPPFVLGIVNARGEILSVVDLKKFFNLPEKGLTDLNKVIVIENGAMRFGVLADVILGISHIPLAAIQPPPAAFTGLRADYLRGVTPEGSIILDAEKILSDRRIVMSDE